MGLPLAGGRLLLLLLGLACAWCCQATAPRRLLQVGAYAGTFDVTFDIRADTAMVGGVPEPFGGQDSFHAAVRDGVAAVTPGSGASLDFLVNSAPTYYGASVQVVVSAGGQTLGEVLSRGQDARIAVIDAGNDGSLEMSLDRMIPALKTVEVIRVSDVRLGRNEGGEGGVALPDDAGGGSEGGGSGAQDWRTWTAAVIMLSCLGCGLRAAIRRAKRKEQEQEQEDRANEIEMRQLQLAALEGGVWEAVPDELLHPPAPPPMPPLMVAPPAAGGGAPQPGVVPAFPYAELFRMTEGFSASHVIGQGSSATVYKGLLPGGGEVAVKLLSEGGGGGGSRGLDALFVKEIDSAIRLQHKFLCPPVGYCWEGSSRALVLQYMERGSLEELLQSRGAGRPPMSWQLRLRALDGMVRGLVFMHEVASPSLVHRDVKSGNVLVDLDYSSKLADFALASSASDCTDLEGGTPGYLPPESSASAAADVFACGVVLLEALTSRNVVMRDSRAAAGEPALLHVWARAKAFDPGAIEAATDWEAAGRWPSNVLGAVLDLARQCLELEPAKRPSTMFVMEQLELAGKLAPAARGTTETRVFPLGAGCTDTKAGPSQGLGLDGDEDNLCCICLTDPRTRRLLPCQHLATCDGCTVNSVMKSLGGAKCPLCRAEVAGHVHSSSNKTFFVSN